MADHDSHLSCSICFQPFDSTQRRPWDIGCGHSYCEQCLRQHPRSFRYCPECRARASNPHVNIGLLRLVDAASANTTGTGHGQSQGMLGSAAGPRRSSDGRHHAPASSQQQQQQQIIAYQPPGAVTTTSSSSNGSGSRSVLQAIQEATAANPRLQAGHRQIGASNPATSIGQLLNASSGSNRAALQTLRPGNLHGSLDQHRAKIAEWRTSMWLYLTPLLGMLYLLSPLDIIPDFLPLIGFLDDFLVIVYIACSIFGMLGQQSDRINL